MDFKEALEKLKDNPELAKSLEEALNKKADTTEIRDILFDAGVDAESAEALIATYQRRRGLIIADDDLDEEMLRKVAGGGYGTNCVFEDDCDSHFKDSSYWNLDRCEYNEVCDQLFCGAS